MRGKKAQASIELLVIIALALFIFIIVIALAGEQVTGIGQSRSLADARAAAKDLSSAAHEVYLQGPGARKLVFMRLPSDYDPANSFIANYTVKIHTGQGDVLSSTDVPVYGTLPSASGGAYLWVVAHEGYVSIGPRSIAYSPGIIVVTAMTASYGQTRYASLNVSNDGSASESVSLNLTWANSDVNFSFFNLADRNFLLAPGASKLINFTVFINASAIGTYVGYIDGTASNGETERINLIVDVSAPACAVNGSGSCVPRKISAKTYRDSLYTVAQEIFDTSQTVRITSFNWAPLQNLSVNIRDSLNASVPGYPATVQSNSTGGFYLEWNPAGQGTGAYTVTANDSSYSTSYPFTISPCT